MQAALVGNVREPKVFGMVERQGKIFTTTVVDDALMNEIRDTAEQGSVFYTDTFRSYTSLKFFGKQRTIDYNT